ncbi:arginine N-succinyltransferase [Parvularcula sp. LCG005]|uniref:arginine N-succinyltransferase n=1 Tax=Parvularcula sp. LCG005 TaxID=3078805 RepID=UPI0029428BA2|nr:arginine N-succinyltransferase [Parvularcula sp. LCG005]WOI53587.1 arginine N-succinyltransferase [Parvularcula sp. LCG005]
MSPFIIRPAREDDLPSLVALAKEAGTGMTTVPQGEDAMAERINASIAAFAGKGRASARDVFFFVMEDEEGAAGMACIFPNLGEDRPFYSYRLSHLATQAPEMNLTASTDILFLVNDFHGYTEVGTLLVAARARGKGAGRFLSLSRFMYLGMNPSRFSDKVMAEIRGHFEEDGTCPFWEHIAAKFFNTSFEEADRQSANDFRFISHLMPKFPIYVSLLPQSCQDIIGKPHRTSNHALNLLSSEGFKWTRCVDIFDGGPSIETDLSDIRTVRKQSKRTLTVKADASHIDGAVPFMVAAQGDQPYVVTMGMGHPTGQTVVIPPEIARRANLANGQSVIAAPLKG